MILSKTKTQIGPQHHGRKMSLKTFEFVQVEDGYHYELARGYIVVADPPALPHVRRVSVIRRHLEVYYMANSDRVYDVLGTMECKLLIAKWQSERHPDLAVYLTPPPSRAGRTQWRRWFPELAIEVVSEGSRDRDYTEKRDEYWSLGIQEYWIVDAKLQQVLILKRGKSQWTEKTLSRKDVCQTRLLPGFKLSCETIFNAQETEG